MRSRRALVDRMGIAGLALAAVLTAVLAAVACRPSPEAVADGDDALAALASPAQSARYDGPFWAREAHRGSRTWRAARALCAGHRELPNCHPVALVEDAGRRRPHGRGRAGCRRWQRRRRCRRRCIRVRRARLTETSLPSRRGRLGCWPEAGPPPGKDGDERGRADGDLPARADAGDEPDAGSGRRAAALCGLGLLLAAAPAAAGVLDDLVKGYQGAANRGWARWCRWRTDFGILAGLEIAVGALMWVVNRRMVDEMLLGFIRKVLVLGLFYAFLSEFPLWVPRIVQGFQAAGQAASRTQDLSPSGVMKVGVDIDTRAVAGRQDGTAGAGGGLLVPLVTLLVMIAFIGIAAQLVMTLVESYLAVTGGDLPGLAAFRGSAPLADSTSSTRCRWG